VKFSCRQVYPVLAFVPQRMFLSCREWRDEQAARHVLAMCYRATEQMLPVTCNTTQLFRRQNHVASDAGQYNSTQTLRCVFAHFVVRQNFAAAGQVQT